MKRNTPGHPKLGRLAKALGCGRAAAVGSLELLWHFAAIHAPRGDVGRYPDDEIEEACYWDGEPGALVAALVACRWLDEVGVESGRLVVHDWAEHCDNAVKKRVRENGWSWAGVEGREEEKKIHHGGTDSTEKTGREKSGEVGASEEKAKEVEPQIAQIDTDEEKLGEVVVGREESGGVATCYDLCATGRDLSSLPEPEPEPEAKPEPQQQPSRAGAGAGAREAALLAAAAGGPGRGGGKKKAKELGPVTVESLIRPSGAVTGPLTFEQVDRAFSLGAAHAGAEMRPLPAGVVVELGAVEVLMGEGFDYGAAVALAKGRTLEAIRRQVGFMARRRCDGNRLGLLRRAIEGDWPEPKGGGGRMAEGPSPVGSFGAVAEPAEDTRVKFDPDPELWLAGQAAIREAVGERNWELWVRPMAFLDWREDEAAPADEELGGVRVIRVRVPSGFFRSWVMTNHQERIEEALSWVGGVGVVRLQMVVDLGMGGEEEGSRGDAGGAEGEEEEATG